MDQTSNKYRSMPSISSEEMLQGYIPVPPPRRVDYCDLCVTDPQTSSAWVRYNERRIDDLQKRLDYLLRLDESEDTLRTDSTVSERIDQMLLGHPPPPRQRVNREQAARVTTPRRRPRSPPFRSLPSTPRVVLRPPPPSPVVVQSSSSHTWRTDVDGKTYTLEQFRIPRYYRLYNDVAFREIYNFSRLLDSYVGSKDYSSLRKSFALEHV